TGLPSESQCAFSPSSLASTGSTTLTVSTTAKTALLRRYHGNLGWSIAFLMFGTFGFCLYVPEKKPYRELFLALFLGLVCFGCGSGSDGGGNNNQPPPNAGTPAGTYNVTVNGTSGSTTHSVQFNLVIFCRWISEE